MLSLRFGVALSAWLWPVLAPRLNPKRHARALDNLAIAFPEKTEAERALIAKAHWENLGRVMAETMQIDRIIREPDRVRVSNAKVFDRYAKKQGPIVGVSLHTGNWEFAIWPMTRDGADVGKRPGAVYRSVTNPYVDRYLRDQRRALFPGGLFGRGKVGDHSDDQRTARLIHDFVRRGGQLGMLCDLYDRTGIPVPFFGKPARTQAIGIMIARRTGARVWMTRCLRIGSESRFEIEIVELWVPRTADQGQDVRDAVAAMQAQFENWIRQSPEQWMWSNRRWS